MTLLHRSLRGGSHLEKMDFWCRLGGVWSAARIDQCSDFFFSVIIIFVAVFIYIVIRALRCCRGQV
jgi:hypothetical protein